MTVKMKSITFGIGYLLSILVVDVSSTDYHISNLPKATFSRPYYFGYLKAHNKLLIMEITLQNIPPSVTAVTAIQFTYDNSWPFSKPQTDEFAVNVDKKTSEGKFMILASLQKRQIWVDVLLHRGVKLCNDTNMMEGREIISNIGGSYWDTTQSKSVFYSNKYNWEYFDDCLAPKTCEIILDLKDTCKEQPKSTYGDNFECRIEESQYICTFVRAVTKQDLVLYQTYEDNSVIGAQWTITQQTTKFTIKLELELFDKNTSVKLVSTWLRKYITIGSYKLAAKDINTASTVPILSYSYTETTDVHFSCEQYKNKYTKIRVGFINTTDNKITTHNTTIMKRNKFKMADNGTILCCIVYEYESVWNEITITRFVENKTLLIYQPHHSTPTYLTESNEQRKVASDDKWWLYLLPTLLGTLVLLLTTYIVKKQRWCANSQPTEETVELDNNPTTNQVLYANLDLVHDERRAGNQTEESPYANIIGLLHPL